MTTWEPFPPRSGSSKAAVKSVCLVRLRMPLKVIGDYCSAYVTHGRAGLLTVSQCRLDGTVGAVVV